MDLERAIEIAVQAHKGASDQGGSPYILHPLSVMHSLDTDDEKIVAVLHDVVEDTEWTFEKLLDEGFSVTVVDALRSVIKQEGGEDYFDFIQRAKKNPLGRKVKIADIQHNPAQFEFSLRLRNVFGQLAVYHELSFLHFFSFSSSIPLGLTMRQKCFLSNQVILPN